MTRINADLALAPAIAASRATERGDVASPTSFRDELTRSDEAKSDADGTDARDADETKRADVPGQPVLSWQLPPTLAAAAAIGPTTADCGHHGSAEARTPQSTIVSRALAGPIAPAILTQDTSITSTDPSPLGDDVSLRRISAHHAPTPTPQTQVPDAPVAATQVHAIPNTAPSQHAAQSARGIDGTPFVPASRAHDARSAVGPRGDADRRDDAHDSGDRPRIDFGPDAAAAARPIGAADGDTNSGASDQSREQSSATPPQRSIDDLDAEHTASSPGNALPAGIGAQVARSIVATLDRQELTAAARIALPQMHGPSSAPLTRLDIAIAAGGSEQIEVQMTIEGDALHLTLVASSPALSRSLEDGRAALMADLSGLSYDLADITIRHAPPDTAAGSGLASAAQSHSGAASDRSAADDHRARTPANQRRDRADAGSDRSEKSADTSPQRSRGLFV